MDASIDGSEIKKTQQDKKIYALGDSLTAWYQLPLDQSYPMQLEVLLMDAWYTYTVINGWKSGDTSAWLLARVDWIIEEANPWDLALLVIWANDWLQSLSLDQLEDNIQDIVTTLQEKDIVPVIGGMQLPTNLDPVYRENFAALYSSISNKNNLSRIPFFLDEVAAIQSLNLADGIHPNKEWYAIIAKNIATFLIENKLITK